MNVYKNIRGTDLVVFVLILFPQMFTILLLKSVPLAQPQISNKIMCPYYPYVLHMLGKYMYSFTIKWHLSSQNSKRLLTHTCCDGL